MRKQLEQCDVAADNNYFIETKSTGSRPPGEPSWWIQKKFQKLEEKLRSEGKKQLLMN